MSLSLVPTLRLRASRIVRRAADGTDQADPTRVAEWAGEMAEAGARWVHVEDLDAREGRASQWTAIPALQSQGLRIQFGGGVLRMVQVQQLLDLGVDRIVLGRQAQAEPRWAEEVVRLYPGKIILCIGGNGEKETVLLERAKRANAWHLGGLLAPEAPGSTPADELITRLHAAAPSPLLFAQTRHAGTQHVAGLHEAGAKGILLHDIATGDLARLVTAFPQRAEVPPIQVLRARGTGVGDEDGDDMFGGRNNAGADDETSFDAPSED